MQAPPGRAGARCSATARQVINPVKSYWWLLLFPALVMSITLLALNFLGDALRDALDPRAREAIVPRCGSSAVIDQACYKLWMPPRPRCFKRRGELSPAKIAVVVATPCEASLSAARSAQ